VTRLLLIAIVGAAVIAAAIGLNFAPWQSNDAAPPALSSQRSNPTAKQPQAMDLEPPTFDLVRVSPNGNTVIAGRAMPDSIVVNLDNGVEFGRIKADDRGDWVFVPELPMTPGTHTLSLKMLVGSSPPVMSEGTGVIIIVPKAGKDIAGRSGNGHILALKMNPDGSSTVLQKPGGVSSIKLSVDTVDYDEGGRLSITGSSYPNSMVQIYLDNKLIGHARTGEDKGLGKGIWAMNPDDPVKSGLYTLRADQIGTDGKVIQRIEFPFSRANPTDKITDENKIVVQPGNSLWRLARSNYGKGNRYTVIFEANKDQIKDPNLIYPGQVLKLFKIKGK
jgi:LysM repeat protein